MMYKVWVYRDCGFGDCGNMENFIVVTASLSEVVQKVKDMGYQILGFIEICDVLRVGVGVSKVMSDSPTPTLPLPVSEVLSC